MYSQARHEPCLCTCAAVPPRDARSSSPPPLSRASPSLPAASGAAIADSVPLPLPHVPRAISIPWPSQRSAGRSHGAQIFIAAGNSSEAFATHTRNGVLSGNAPR